MAETVGAPDEVIRRIREVMALREALANLVEAFVTPGYRGPFEAGEVPALDAARTALSGAPAPVRQTVCEHGWSSLHPQPCPECEEGATAWLQPGG